MKYNCDRCGVEMDFDENIKTTCGGIDCTYGQYIELTKDNDSVLVCCMECINKMQDAWPFFEAGLVEQIPTPEANN